MGSPLGRAGAVWRKVTCWMRDFGFLILAALVIVLMGLTYLAKLLMER